MLFKSRLFPKLSAALVLLIFGLFMIKEASVGQVHYENISLEQLISRSDYIFIARKLDPAYTTEEIKIHRDIKKYPPFKKIIYHFNVIDELLNKGEDSYKGKDIDVIPEDLETELKIHKLYYLEGIHKSPIYLNYESSADFSKSTELIVFLRLSSDGQFAFAAGGAYEAVSKKQEIVKKIQRLEGKNEENN
jgi:hypothetical protein